MSHSMTVITFGHVTISCPGVQVSSYNSFISYTSVDNRLVTEHLRSHQNILVQTIRYKVIFACDASLSFQHNLCLTGLSVGN